MELGVLSFVYSALKDFIKLVASDYPEEEKEVNLDWYNTTPLKQKWENEGYANIKWIKRNELEKQIENGFVKMKDRNKKDKKIYSFVERSSDLILIGSKLDKSQVKK